MTEPLPGVAAHRPIGCAHGSQAEVVGPSPQFAVQSGHQIYGLLPFELFRHFIQPRSQTLRLDLLEVLKAIETQRRICLRFGL